MADPDLLLLDEPETHLDAVRRSALERVIRSYQGAVVMVSHDRYMLDETISAIAELDAGRVRMWPGNYSSYATARELALLQQQEQWRARQKEIDRLNDAIRRYKQWRAVADDPRHTTRIKNAERRIEKLDTVERPVLERRKIGLQLRSAERGGKRVVDLRGVTAAFDSDPVLVDVDLTIFRGERLAVIGPNGAGKSVLLSLITGALEPVMGERWVGPSIKIGALAQEHSPGRRGGHAGGHDPPSAALPRRAGRDRTDALPVHLRAGAPADHVTLGRRAHPAGTAAADAKRRQLPGAGRAHQPPRHRLGGDARGRDRAV